jgi:hypothetical protein
VPSKLCKIVTAPAEVIRKTVPDPTWSSWTSCCVPGAPAGAYAANAGGPESATSSAGAGAPVPPDAVMP